MARKDKNKYQEKQPQSAEEVVLIPEVVPEVLVETPKERIWSLQDAARQMIKGYKEAWWPSIHHMAKTHAVKDNASESQCRSLFLKWGAELK